MVIKVIERKAAKDGSLWHREENFTAHQKRPWLHHVCVASLGEGSARFVPRARGAGGPLDEMRLLVDAITANAGALAADEAIAYDPAKSVLKIDIGDRVALNADDFEAIAAAFLAGIERSAA